MEPSGKCSWSSANGLGVGGGGDVGEGVLVFFDLALLHLYMAFLIIFCLCTELSL